MAKIHKIASAVYNDLQAGLAGFVATPTMSMQQLEDEVVEERLFIIKQYSLKNMLPIKDLLTSLNCIPVDCKSLDKCCEGSYSPPIAHFEIPQTINDFGEEAIFYVGATDKQFKFKVYTNPSLLRAHKYKLRGKNKPYVYIDTTPNEHNMYDGYIFNAPLLERLTVIAAFKDPRQVEQFECCEYKDTDNFSWIDTEVKTSLLKKKFIYYRQGYVTPQPNNQVPQ